MSAIVPHRHALRACERPCAWCGADESGPDLAGALLTENAALRAGENVRGVGVWVALPERVRALRVALSGDAIERGIVAPTAARMRAADVRDAERDLWRGAPFQRARVGETACLVANFGEVTPRGDSLARVAVIDVAGFVRDAGEGDLVARVIADGSGCASRRARVRVGGVAPVPDGVAGCYAATEGDFATCARRLLAWADDVTAALASRGRFEHGAGVRLVTPRGRTETGRVSVGPRGLGGAAWERVARAMGQGRAAAVELWDVCDPDALGVSLALGTRASVGPGAACVWARDADVTAAWRRAVERDLGGWLQAVIGRWDEPVTPRVVTAWERAQGVRGVSFDRASLATRLRAPGDWTLVRGR